jgi:hypothetical protein
MSIWPYPVIEPLVTITPWSQESIGDDLNACGTGTTAVLRYAISAVWPLASLAIFVPFTLTKQITVLEAFVYNGATVSGSWDVGVYSNDGNKIFSTGAVAQSTASVIQSTTVSSNTFRTFGPGNFYLGMSTSTAAGTYFRAAPTNAQICQMMGMASAVSAYVLPSSVTFASISTATVPVFGITTRSVV